MRPNVEHKEDPTLDPTGERTSSPRSNDQTNEEVNEHPTQRVTVAEAARLLGTSAEAVRMRVKRGSLKSTKIKNTVYVLLTPEQTRPNQDQTSGGVGSAAYPPTDQTHDQTYNQTDDRTALLESLRSQVEFLQEELKRREDVHVEENRRKDTIIAQLTQRIPEIEAPSERQRSPETASEGPYSTHAPPEGQSQQGQPGEAQRKRSWWREFFGME
jgi:hypothetical protein